MANVFVMLTRAGDKSGSLGALVAAMGCSFCFPAIASLGAVIGLGFLAQWEGFLLTRVLPAAAILTLIVNILGYFHHRQWYWSLLGVIESLTILLVLNFWFATSWRTDVIYSALGVMILVSVWDIFWPANRHCKAGMPGDNQPPRQPPLITSDTGE